MSTVLTGMTRASADGAAISFCHDLAPGSWIAIPKEIVAKSETITAGTERHPGYGRLRITLKDATTAEGRMLESLVPTMAGALLTLSHKVGPALEPKPAAQASSACLHCLEQCKTIVSTQEDPFAQIICILNCADCP